MAHRERIYQAIYAFGDSYIDNGNFYEASGHVYQPDPPYWNGRWMDGPNFVDVLAENLGMEPIKPSATGGTNYGVGGATVAVDWDYKGVLIKSAKTQVEEYLAGLRGGPADARGLYVFFAGGGDIIGAFQEGMDSESANAHVRRTADDHVALVKMLADRGAGSFLVLDEHDIGKMPVDAYRNPLATELCKTFNEALAAGLEDLKGVSIVCFDFEAWMASIRPDFEVTDALFIIRNDFGPTDPPYKGLSEAANSDAYLYFDDWGHLSARANRLLGNAVTEAVLKGMNRKR